MCLKPCSHLESISSVQNRNIATEVNTAIATLSGIPAQQEDWPQKIVIAFVRDGRLTFNLAAALASKVTLVSTLFS